MKNFTNFLVANRKNRSRLFSYFVMAVALMLPIAAVAQTTSTLVKPFTPRTGTLNDNLPIWHIKGDFTLIGNANLTLQTYSPTQNNDGQNMVYVKTDAANPFRINSSSAELRFANDGNAQVDHNCTEVLFAGLYWTARNYNGTAGTNANQYIDVPTQTQGTTHNVNNQQYIQGHGNIIIPALNPNPPGHPQIPIGCNMTVSYQRPSGVTNRWDTYYTFSTPSNSNVFMLRWLTTASSYNGDIAYSTNGGTTWTTLNKGTVSTNGTVATQPVTNPPTFTILPGLTVTINSLIKSTNSNSNTTTTTGTLCPALTISVNGSATIINTDPVRYWKNQVQFRHQNDATYHQQTASVVSYPGYPNVPGTDIVYPTENNAGGQFVAYADVTDYVRQHGLGNYWVADIACRDGQDGAQDYGLAAGWGLVVIYQNELMKWRDITVFDGCAYITSSGNTQSIDFPVTGFHAVQTGPVGVKLGLMAFEGDVSSTGDYFAARNNTTNAFVNLTNGSTNSATNFFNSSIYNPVNGVVPPRNPNLVNNTGMDIHMFNLNNDNKQFITNNQTSITFRSGSSQEQYTIFNLIVSIDAYIPDPETTNIIYHLEDKNGVQILPNSEGVFTAFPETKIRYALEIRNKGSEAINNMVIKIPVPYITEFDSAWFAYPTNPYNPATNYNFTAPQPTFDPLEGSRGQINWNMGTLPLATDNNHLFATLYFELTVTDQCPLLITAGTCEVGVVIDGLVDGIGATTGVAINNKRFIYGWTNPQQGDPCQQPTPLYFPPKILIDAGDQCTEYSGIIEIPVCVAETATTIPYEAVTIFPRTRFYTCVTSEGKPCPNSEVTPQTHFPKNEDLMYAFPFAIEGNECYYIFKFKLLPIPSFVSIPNDDICGGECTNLVTLVDWETLEPEESELYFYSALPHTPENRLSPNEEGEVRVCPWVNTTYYAVSNVEMGYGCVSDPVQILVRVHTTVVQSNIIANNIAVCSGGDIEFHASNNLSIPNPIYKWYKTQDSEDPIVDGIDGATLSVNGADFSINPITTLVTKDTTFYVGIYDPRRDTPNAADFYCETPPGYRKPVTAIIRHIPVLEVEVPRNFLCDGGQGFREFPLIPYVDRVNGVSTYPGTTDYYWEWYDQETNEWLRESAAMLHGSGFFTLAWQGTATVTDMHSHYYPSSYEIGKYDEVHIRFNFYAGECGWLQSEAIILRLPEDTPSIDLEIVQQPADLQEACDTLYYTVLITGTAKAGVKNMKVNFEDWKVSQITMVKAEFIFPIEPEEHIQHTNWNTFDWSTYDGQWEEMEIFDWNNFPVYAFNFPPIDSVWVWDPYLHEEDPGYYIDEVALIQNYSVLVRFTLFDACDFFAGADYRIWATGQDFCQIGDPNFVIAPEATTDVLHLDWKGVDMAEYSMTSEFIDYQGNPMTTPYSIENMGGGSVANRTVTWRVNYTLIDGEPTDHDNIYFNIPVEMSLKSIMLHQPSSTICNDLYNYPVNYNFSSLETHYEGDPNNKEYRIPVCTDMQPNEYCVFDITFVLDDTVSCGDYLFYVEIIHEEEILCKATNEDCTFSETLASSYQDLLVKLYSFEPIHGSDLNYASVITYDPATDQYILTSKHLAKSNTALHAGDILHAQLIIDHNNNRELDEDERENYTRAEFNYPTFNRAAGDSLIFYLGHTLPWNNEVTTPAVQIECGKSMFLLLTGTHVCDDLIIPVATICGPAVICEKEVVEYYAPGNMRAYLLEVREAEAPHNLVDAKYWNATTQGTIIFGKSEYSTTNEYIPQGEYLITVRYPFFENNDLINITYMQVTVAPHPELGYATAGVTDTTICRGATVELTHFFAITPPEDFDIYYFTKNGTDTIPLTPVNGKIDVSPWNTTTYYAYVVSKITGCEMEVALPFTVKVNTMPQIGTIMITYSACSEPTGAINVNMIGGSGTYLWSFEEEGEYTELNGTGDITGLAPDNYVLYIKDVLEYGCPPSVSQPFSISTTKNFNIEVQVKANESSCGANDGEIYISASGGTPNYYYSIDGGTPTLLPATGIIGGLSSAVHAVTVIDSDNECPANKSVLIAIEENNNEIEITHYVTSLSTCIPDYKDGIVSIAVSGGTSPYKYQIDGKGWQFTDVDGTAAFELNPGKHVVSVIDFNGCTNRDTINMPGYSNLSFDVDFTTDVNCSGDYTGSITLKNVQGAPLPTGDFTYSINGGQSTGIIYPGHYVIPDLTMGIYSVTIYDGMGCPYTIDGIEINRRPEIVQAMDNVFYTYIDEPVSGFIKYNDFELWHQDITMMQPYPEITKQNGEIEITETGHFIYTPPEGFTGKDSVWYRVQNECGMIDGAWVIIVVLPRDIENHPPVALQDEYTTSENTPVTFDVRLNDYNPETESSAGLSNPNPMTLPSHGTLVRNPDGTFTYTPNHGFAGVDMFIYEVCIVIDNVVTNRCATAQVHITVNKNSVLEQYCEATDDYYYLLKYETLTVTTPGILINDKYPSCETPIVTLLDSVLYGELILYPDGTFIYTPDLGYTGSDRFSYQLCTDNEETVCDIAFVYIFIPDRACPDMPVYNMDSASICYGENIDLEDLIQTGAQNMERFEFYYDNQYENLMTSNVVSTAGYYYIRAYNQYRCYVDDKTKVTVNPLPTVHTTVTGKDTTACSDDVWVFNLNHMAETNGTGLIFSDYRDFHEVFGSSIFTMFSGGDTWVYIRGYNSQTGCQTDLEDIDSVRIRVFPLPTFTIAKRDTAVCSATAITFDLSEMANGAGIQFSESKAFANLITSITLQPDASAKVYVRALNANTGCISAITDSVTLTVNPFADASPIIISGITSLCGGNTTQLTASLPPNTPVINPVFRWYATETSTQILGTGAVFTTPVITANTSFYVSVSGDNYCESENRKQVEIVTATIRPTIRAITPLDDICEGRTITFTTAITNAGDNPLYQWNVNNVPVQGAVNPQFTYAPANGDIITCTLTSQDPCANPPSVTSAGIAITVHSYPEAPVINVETLTAFPGHPVNLCSAVDMIPGLTYTFYENPDKTGRINGCTVIYLPPKDDYYVSASNGFCEGELSQIILKIPCDSSVFDEEGHEYKVIPLAGFCWTENLQTTLYPGTSNPIPFANPYTCTGCPSQLDAIFGLLYTWYSATGEFEAGTRVQGICPDGYHIPTKAEWSALERYTAQQLKSTKYWLDPPGPGTDNYGFDARPAGWYNGAIDRYQDLYGFTGWWSADDNNSATQASYFSLTWFCTILQGDVMLKTNGLSVRCVMDY